MATVDTHAHLLDGLGVFGAARSLHALHRKHDGTSTLHYVALHDLLSLDDIALVQLGAAALDELLDGVDSIWQVGLLLMQNVNLLQRPLVDVDEGLIGATGDD